MFKKRSGVFGGQGMPWPYSTVFRFAFSETLLKVYNFSLCHAILSTHPVCFNYHNGTNNLLYLQGNITMTNMIIGVDLGGTQIRAARLDHHLDILERRKTLTLAEEGLEPTLARIKNLIREVLPDDGTPIAGIGISAPGPLNPITGVVVAPPNLHGWHNVPLGDILHGEFGVPAYVGNDANVAALAETARGAAQGYRHVIYITVSTGIGSGVIVNGRLLLGREGLAAEFGHTIIVVEGDKASSVELEAAGPALARQAMERLEAGESSLIRELVDGDLNRVDARIIGQAQAQGDNLAQEIVERGGRIVGLGIVNLLHLFNPEIVVVGGGVTKIGEPLFAPMRAAVQQHTMDDAYWRDLPIERPTLGGDVSIIGAAALVVTKGGQTDVTEVVRKLED